MLGRRRLRWGIAATAIALAAGGAPPAVADGGAGSVVTAVTFNMAGWGHWRGNPLAGDLVAERIAASDSNPVIVGLNEVCGSEDETDVGDTQLARLAAALGPAWKIGFAATREAPSGGLVPAVRDGTYGGNCPAVGNALLVRDAPQGSTETVHPLMNPATSNHDRNLVCGSAPVPVCVTHLDPLHATDQAGQAYALVDQHDVHLVLGDFNLRPDADALDDWYGAFDEGDELQRPTHLEGKIDYVFADKTMYEPVGASVTPFVSDHLWYEATFSVESLAV